MVIYNNNVWEGVIDSKRDGVLFILIKMQTQGMIIDWLHYKIATCSAIVKCDLMRPL